MRCPACDTEMNCHAEKPLKESAAEGEVIASIHCCPACGKVEAAIQAQDPAPPNRQ